jgi:hypothetical protein
MSALCSRKEFRLACHLPKGQLLRSLLLSCRLFLDGVLSSHLCLQGLEVREPIGLSIFDGQQQ